MKKYAICFLTVSPCESFYHFCKMLNDSEYTVYFCVDNNEYQIPHFQKEDIKIIKVDREVCEKEGFHSTVAYFPDGYACSRDKALYYFCRIEPNVYDAAIDTTFALYKPYTNGFNYVHNALRTGGNYQLHHLPWYEDSENPLPEDLFYRKNIRKGASHWIVSS